MIRLRERKAAFSAAILLIVLSLPMSLGFRFPPLALLCLACLTFGVWALVVLCRQDVKDAFAANRGSLVPSSGARKRHLWLKRAGTLAIMVVLVFLVRQYVLAMYRMESDFAAPAIPKGSHVFVYKLARTFEPGDIVLYRNDRFNLFARVLERGLTDGNLTVERLHCRRRAGLCLRGCPASEQGFRLGWGGGLAPVPPGAVV